METNRISGTDDQPEEYKTVEELLELGGKFYTMYNQSWCDTALDSWVLIPGKGYSRANS